MNIADKIVEIRKYRRLTQIEVSEWFDLSQQAWQKKESGKSVGFNLNDIEMFLKKTNIDSRFLFGQIENIEDADLLLTKKNNVSYEDLYNKINDLQEKVTPVKDPDPIAYRVKINEPLRKLVSKIQYLDANMIEKLDVLITGFLAANDVSGKQKESAAG